MPDRSLASDFKAAILATFDPTSGVQVLDYDEAADEATLPAIYVVVSLTRRVGGDYRLSGDKLALGWRAVTTCVGLTVDECRWAQEHVGAVEDRRLALTGYDCTQVRLESDTAPEPDNGRYSAATSWTFVTTPALVTP